MVAYVNRVELIGFLGGAVELRTTPKGKQVGTFNLGTTSFRKVEGAKVEKTTWHRVVVAGSNAEFAAQYLGKGSYVRVEGSLDNRSYEDTQGVKRYISEVFGRVESLDRRRPAEQEDAANPAPEPTPMPEPDYASFDDDLPE